MFNQTSGYSLADIAAATGATRNGDGGFGFGGDGAWWIIILFLLVGWGNGGYGYGGGGADTGSVIYPWMNQADVTRSGFAQAATDAAIGAVQSSVGDITTQLCGGFGDVQNALCGGFAGVNASINNGFASAEAAATARQMANMQQAFNSQTAITNGLTNLSSQFAECLNTVGTYAA